MAYGVSPDIMPEAEMPDLAWLMVATRKLNGFLGTSYTVEQVRDMNPEWILVVDALRMGYVKHLNAAPGDV